MLFLRRQPSPNEYDAQAQFYFLSIGKHCALFGIISAVRMHEIIVYRAVLVVVVVVVVVFDGAVRMNKRQMLADDDRVVRSRTRREHFYITLYRMLGIVSVCCKIWKLR